ncbi:MAG: YbjN domain-containing protein [Xenococcaceae cyanobacterium MO_167.B27]|nr:YbjN domain-containing protein [Xenococcaceae cyanobacterium MO_167.B27]
MKNFSWFLLLLLLSITLSAEAQTANEDFCTRFPLNARCRENSLEKETNSSRNNFNSSENEIVDILDIEAVEKHLRELGYTNFTRNNNNSLSLLIQGRPCSVFIASNGKGMSLFSYFPKDEKTTLEVLNDWNKSLRYSFAYIYETKKNNELVILETNLTVTGGVTEERIKSFFLLHTDYQTRFSQYLAGL